MNALTLFSIVIMCEPLRAYFVLYDKFIHRIFAVKLLKSTAMAIKITEECINCGACEPECPNTAIYEGGREWTWAGGTKLTEVKLDDGSLGDAKVLQKPVSDEFYYIVSGK